MSNEVIHQFGVLTPLSHFDYEYRIIEIFKKRPSSNARKTDINVCLGYYLNRPVPQSTWVVVEIDNIFDKLEDAEVRLAELEKEELIKDIIL